MNNLKRVLSLGLTGAMLTGMMMVGASAADFVDADEIVNTEAVNTMVALNVINGKEDGSHFDPTATVTRAEMAKIITVMLNGGVAPTLGNSSKSTFTDVAANHWARGYIEYCVSKGIVAGRGNGTFGPEADVTGSEAAKMLLVALGYDSDVFGFTGIDWEINTNSTANDAKLYTELNTIDPTVGLTRDNAAQMAYNALDAKVMEKRYDKVLSNGEISYNYDLGDDTFLNKYFDAKTFVGTFVGNDKTGDASVKGEVQISGKNTTDPSVDPARPAFLPADLDLANIGEEIKVIYKDAKGGVANTPDKKDLIYGVFNTGNTTVYNITKGDIQDVDTANDKIKFGGVKYDYVTGGRVLTNYGVADATLTDASLAALKADSADDVKLIANDEGKIEAAYVTARAFYPVASVNSEKVQINGLATLTIADHDVYEGIAKDDVVMVTQLYKAAAKDATYIVEKAEILAGTVDKFFSTTKVNVDGATITADAALAAITKGDGTANYNVVTMSGHLGEELEFVMYGDRFVAAKVLTESDKDYAMILGANDGDTINGQSVKLLLADGTEKTYAIDAESNVGSTDPNMNTYFEAGHPTTDLDSSTGLNTLVSYSITNAGKVKMTLLTPATADANTKYDKNTKSFTFTTGTTALTTSDAVAFVKDRSGKWIATTAAKLGDVTVTFGSTVYSKAVDGKLVVLAMETGSDLNYFENNTQYMYITAAPAAYKNGDKTYTTVSGVTAGGEEVSITVENDVTNSAKVQKGAFIKYVTGSDDLTKLTKIDLLTTAGRVSEYDAGRKLLVVGSTATPVADDVVIINVNTADVTAGDSVGISVADTVDVTANNVIVVTGTVDGITKVVAVFVDDDRDLKMNAVEMAAGSTATAIATQLASSDVKVDAASIDGAITVPAGRTLTITDAATDAALNNLTASEGAKVVLTTGYTTSAALTNYYATKGTAPVVDPAAPGVAGTQVAASTPLGNGTSFSAAKVYTDTAGNLSGSWVWLKNA